VHADRQGNLKHVSKSMKESLKLDTKPAHSAAAAQKHAQSLFTHAVTAPTSSKLVVYARGAKPALAHDVLVTGEQQDGTPSEMHYIVDANTLQVLEQWDDIHTASSAGTGNSLFSGAVPLTTNSLASGFELRDPSRGSHYTINLKNRTSGTTVFTDADNIWGNFLTSDASTAGVDATFGQNLTWDYYKNMFGRNGIANDGRGAYTRVHYSTRYVNAFWSDSCFCMTYGDGDGVTYLPLVTPDIAGHEMTHGVTSRTAGLIYSGESGGLNEAMSDIFGTLVEYSATTAKYPANYLVGERIYTVNNGVNYPTKALRYMFKPSIDTRSPDCYVSTIGSLDVHYSSGVANHFFYLLAEGAVTPTGFTQTPSQLVCNGNTAITGIGRDAAARIMYRALTTYMTSSTNYAAARVATLRAATDLFGLNSAQYNAVAAAWSAVSVN
jgi:zinc metalloprotease ZmpA